MHCFDNDEPPNKRLESDSLRRRFAPPPLAADAQRMAREWKPTQ